MEIREHLIGLDIAILDTIMMEMRGYAPMGLSYKGHCGNYKIYSSPKIEQNALQWIDDRFKSRKLVDAIRRGLQSHRILIGYVSKGMFGFLFRKLRKKTIEWLGENLVGLKIDSKSNTLGLYNSKDDVIAIILDDNVSLTGRSFTHIPEILVHELCHKAAAKDTAVFIRTQLQTLVEFYTSFINLIINPGERSIDVSSVKSLVLDLIYAGDKMYSKRSVGLSMDIWNNFFKRNGYNTRDSESMTYLVFAPLFGYIINTYPRSMSRDLINRTEEIFDKYTTTYKMMGYPHVEREVLCGQEAMYPSEVVSVMSEKNVTPETISMIDNLKFQ